MVELGESALVALIFISLFQSLVPWIFQNRKIKLELLKIHKIAQVTQYFQFFLITFSFLSLIYAYVVTDLRLFNVAMNSHHEASLLYRVTGVWGNHEGSMMLWLWLLVFYGMGVSVLSSCPMDLKIKTLGFQSFFTSAFAIFVVLTSNPFLKAKVPFLTGRDLNPILQDPALAFHPPALYLGLTGFSIVLSFALASLGSKEVNGYWVHWVRPWALAAWSFLTIGITMGSWWAYYELGWGGWWFWDPVENASLMPWLASTALIHTYIMVVKDSGWLKWTWFLSPIPFLLALLGTCLVRSGLLSSVHSFASDPKRGVFLGTIFGLTLALSFFMMVSGFRKIKTPDLGKEIFLKSKLMIINNYFLMLLTFIVFLGTVYPLILESLTGDLITVGPPYYGWTFVPFVLPLLVLMGVNYSTGWAGQENQNVSLNLWAPFVIVSSLFLLFWIQFEKDMFSLLMICGSAWILVTTCRHLWRQKFRPRSWSMILAHGGLAITVLGMGLDTLGKQERLVGMKEGDSILFQQYELSLISVAYVNYPPYKAERAHIKLTKDGCTYSLYPEKRYYASHQTLTTETALYHTWLSNLYFALGSALPGGRWTLRLYYHPWVELIWLGGLIMASGGLITLIPKRWTLKFFKHSVMILFLFFGCWESLKAVEIGERLLDPSLEARARTLSNSLKCPVCAGQSIDDSHAPLARALRRQVREEILNGKSNQEILDTLKTQYGESVMFTPSFNRMNSLLWILPFILALGIGGYLWFRVINK